MPYPSGSLLRGGRLVLLAATLGLAAGCGGAGDKLYPVKGKVVFKDNGQPLPGGTVLFQTAGDDPKRASGELELDGTFTLGSPGGPGACAGDYQVLLTNPPTEGNYSIHPKYQQFATSGLTFKVTPGGENFCEIKVERGPKR
jgi:hypothetical protein